MKNYVQPGHSLDLTAPSGGVVSGAPLLVGSLFVVPSTTAAEAELFAGQIDGVFEFTAATHATDQAWTEGMKVYWDNTAKAVTKTSTSNTLIGVAAEAKASTAAAGKVRLNGTSV